MHTAWRRAVSCKHALRRAVGCVRSCGRMLCVRCMRHALRMVQRTLRCHWLLNPAIRVLRRFFVLLAVPAKFSFDLGK